MLQGIANNAGSKIFFCKKELNKLLCWSSLYTWSFVHGNFQWKVWLWASHTYKVHAVCLQRRKSVAMFPAFCLHLTWKMTLFSQPISKAGARSGLKNKSYLFSLLIVRRLVNVSRAQTTHIIICKSGQRILVIFQSTKTWRQSANVHF